MIPDEAVEAAAKVLLHGWLRYSDPADFAKSILEAAAPHLMAALRADLVKLAKEFDTTEGGTLAYTVTDGRHGMRKNAHDQLMYVICDHLGGIAS